MLNTGLSDEGCVGGIYLSAGNESMNSGQSCFIDCSPSSNCTIIYCESPISISSVDLRASGPNDIGSNCPSVITVDLLSLSYIRIGILSYTHSVSSTHILSPRCNDIRTSQNSRMNCLHIPQGLAGGLMSVATARARISPFFAPFIAFSKAFSR